MWYIWVGAILFALLLLMYFPWRIRVEFAYSKNANQQLLQIFLFRAPVFKSAFAKSAKPLKAGKNAQAEKESAKQEEPENKKTDFEKFSNELEDYKAIYTKRKDELVHLLKFLANRCKIYKFVIHLDLGFEDAMQTGIAAGAAYGMVFGFAALIYNTLNVSKKDVDVYVRPQFDKACIDFYLNWIFRLRLAHIIKVLWFVYKIYKDIQKNKKKR